jgi:type I restriction-modification system DNA methylase subunit
VEGAAEDLVGERVFDERADGSTARITKRAAEDVPKLYDPVIQAFEDNPWQDLLGDVYMRLSLGSKQNGQFFTPYSVCQMMAECTIDEDLLKSQIEKHGWISVNDCACGAGATLVAAANWLKEMGFDYQSNALFVAQDIDSTTALMCYIQMSLLGCPGYVIIGDTLAAPQTGDVLLGEDSSRCWFTPMYFLHAWRGRRTRTKSGYEKPEEPRPTFTVSTRKKNEGQLMFEFGD